MHSNSASSEYLASSPSAASVEAILSDSSLSSVPLKVRLDSGNQAVYLVQPQHLPRERISHSVAWPRELGQQLAHEKDGHWYRPGGWTPIDDARAIELLDAVAEVAPASQLPRPSIRGDRP